MSIKQLEVTTKTIGEFDFYIKPFPAFVAANISGELAALLSPILGGLSALLGSNGTSGNAANFDIMDMELEQALPSISNAFSSLSGEKFEKLMKKLLIDNKNISYEGPDSDGKARILSYDAANEIFCGEVQDMYILCFEVIKVNYGGFFKKLGSRFGNLQGLLQTVIPSQGNTEN